MKWAPGRRALLAWLRDRTWAPQRLGRRGERVAARYLRRRGLRILGRNVRSGRGEIDIVALDGQTLVFVEVKSRTSRSLAAGTEKLDGRKRRALRRACRVIVATTAGRYDSFRVDAVIVDFGGSGLWPRTVDVTWIPAAVELDLPV